ncbi:MAG: YybH family protein [Isosphaeraceae bacterium]
MIRCIECFAIGLAFFGSLTPLTFGQVFEQQVAVPVQVQPIQVGAPVQVQPVQVPTVEASAAGVAVDEKALRQTLGAYVAAYNQKDAAKLVEFFTPDGTLIDSGNAATRGREAIAQEFSEAFAQPSTYTLEGKVERIHAITPDVAQVEGVSRLVSPKEATIVNHFVALLARRGDDWKLVEIRDYPEPGTGVTPYERLKELEWMVGDWVDETEDAQVSTTVQWGQGKGYLVRNYSAQIKGGPAKSGLIIIAWDPQTEQIKSWIFSADGGRGEGSWTRAEENQWVVKVHGSTADGRPSSATQILSLVNKDAVRARSIDRIVGGEIAPDIDDIIMVRKPPAPSTATAPASEPTSASIKPAH